MNTAELKSTLHKLIIETDDTSILDKVQAYFTMLKTKNVDWWEMLSDTDKSNIETGIKQMNEGKGISHEKVQKKVNNLLGR